MNEADLKPHQSQYWLNPPDPIRSKVKDICEVYLSAMARAQKQQAISIDEMTGIQARTEVS